MRNIWIAFLCCVLLCGCGNSKKDETEPVLQEESGGAEEYTQLIKDAKEETEEVIETEPSALTIGGIEFTVPGCFGASSGEDATGGKYYYPNGKNEWPALYISFLEADWAQEDFDEHRDKVCMNLIKDIKGAQAVEGEDILIGGLSGRTVEFKINAQGTGVTGYISVVYNAGEKKCVFIMLMQETETKYDYLKDYEKILQSAVVLTPPVESPPVEEEPEPVPSEPEETEEPATSEDTVDPELKEFLDSYEACINEYVDFMKKYTSSNDVMGMLSDYTTIMSKYADFTKKMDNINEDDLTGADLAYYIEVTSRCTQKMLEIYQ